MWITWKRCKLLIYLSSGKTMGLGLQIAETSASRIKENTQFYQTLSINIPTVKAALLQTLLPSNASTHWWFCQPSVLLVRSDLELQISGFFFFDKYELQISRCLGLLWTSPRTSFFSMESGHKPIVMNRLKSVFLFPKYPWRHNKILVLKTKKSWGEILSLSMGKSLIKTKIGFICFRFFSQHGNLKSWIWNFLLV